jgi:thioredoxin reductase (NADPH)
MSLQFTLGKPEGPAPVSETHDVIVIGSGPAGYTAALYTSRAHLDTLVIAGEAVGGQVATTWEVDNYPGFPEGLTGPELVERLQKHSERFGARLEMDQVTNVDLSQHPFRLVGYARTYFARALIVAVGASPRKLDVPGERRLTGRGVSYCGTCDGWFFQDKQVAVIGGGDSALEEALFLTRFASKVTIIHRRDQLRAGPALQSRVERNGKIGYLWNTVVEEILGEKTVQSLCLRHVNTGEITEFPVDGVFVFIGHIPNTDIFQGQLDTDELGYIKTDQHRRTSVAGVWVAGEAGDPHYRQVITSAGMGAMAAIEAQRWLDSLGD